MVSRSPAEVSLYLGLATAIATFVAASVALGLLQCRHSRDRLAAVAVMLFATVGIAAALLTVARGRTSGLGNILIGIGLLMAAAFVLTRAMRLIFTVENAQFFSSSTTGSQDSPTRRLRVVWTRDSQSSPSAVTKLTAAPPKTVLRGPLRATSAAFLVAVLVATAAAAPDVRNLVKNLLEPRPVGQVDYVPTDFRARPLDGGRVAFSWTNDEPRPGDRFAVKYRVDDRQPRIVKRTQPEFEVTARRGTIVCAQVQLVRSDATASLATDQKCQASR